MRAVQFLISSIPFLIQFYADKYYRDDLKETMGELETESNVPRIKTYDFIVVGGGTAGCVVAGRLSEKFNVLLLEAGGTPPPAAEVPYFAIPVALNPDINYFYKSIPMSTAAKAAGGVVINHTGKMLGGSGSHNDLIHSRGSPRDYDNWAVITNDSSWTYANVLQYFKKSENFIGHQYGSDNPDEFYGKGGPITVDTNITPMLPIWFEAGRELGYDIGDPNGFQTQSFTPVNKAIREGHRTSAYSEYIRPYEGIRANLTIIRYANVSEILLNESSRAYGVAYTRHGFPQIAHSSNEIILSAGAFSSPLLLIKSGIGPVKTLEEAEIPVKVPLEAVGNNLAEHPAIVLSPFHINDSSLFPRINPEDTEKLVNEYNKNGGGILGGIHEGPQCFIESTKADKGWPDIWIPIYPELNLGTEPEKIIFYVVLGRPKSKGTLGFNATAYRAGIRDDTQLALIDFNMLSHPDDVDVMLEGIKFAFKIAENTTAFKKLDMKYAAVPVPECIAFEFRSDEYWKCVLQENTLSWIHMIGTCRMGPDSGSSDNSVVDSKFRVRGVERLRVVDASVIPEVPNANTNAPILMIAEKAADEILKTWSPV